MCPKPQLNTHAYKHGRKQVHTNTTGPMTNGNLAAKCCGKELLVKAWFLESRSPSGVYFYQSLVLNRCFLNVTGDSCSRLYLILRFPGYGVCLSQLEESKPCFHLLNLQGENTDLTIPRQQGDGNSLPKEEDIYPSLPMPTLLTHFSFSSTDAIFTQVGRKGRHT